MYTAHLVSEHNAEAVCASAGCHARTNHIHDFVVSCGRPDGAGWPGKCATPVGGGKIKAQEMHATCESMQVHLGPLDHSWRSTTSRPGLACIQLHQQTMVQTKKRSKYQHADTMHTGTWCKRAVHADTRSITCSGLLWQCHLCTVDCSFVCAHCAST